MRRLTPRLLAAAFVTIAVLAPLPAQALDSPTDIVVQGGSTIFDSKLWDNVIAPGFEAKYPQYTVSFVSTGTFLRATDVRLDPSGAFGGVVRRSVAHEDGVRLEITVEGGDVTALAAAPGPQPGERVRLTVVGGVAFPRDAVRNLPKPRGDGS